MAEMPNPTDTPRWYAVCESDGDQMIGAPHDRIWTLSRDPNRCGWETESGCPGYGLMRADAEFLAAAANEKIEQPSPLDRLEEAIGALSASWVVEGNMISVDEATRLANAHTRIQTLCIFMIGRIKDE